MSFTWQQTERSIVKCCNVEYGCISFTKVKASSTDPLLFHASSKSRVIHRQERILSSASHAIKFLHFTAPFIISMLQQYWKNLTWLSTRVTKIGRSILQNPHYLHWTEFTHFVHLSTIQDNLSSGNIQFSNSILYCLLNSLPQLET